MIDISKHINLGNGVTAEILQGTVILFRTHKDPNQIPGELVDACVAHQPDGEKLLIAENGEDVTATCVFHGDLEGEKEMKALVGRMSSVDQRRRVRKYLESLNLGGAKVERVNKQA